MKTMSFDEQLAYLDDVQLNCGLDAKPREWRIRELATVAVDRIETYQGGTWLAVAPPWRRAAIVEPAAGLLPLQEADKYVQLHVQLHPALFDFPPVAQLVAERIIAVQMPPEWFR